VYRSTRNRSRRRAATVAALAAVAALGAAAAGCGSGSGSTAEPASSSTSGAATSSTQAIVASTYQTAPPLEVTRTTVAGDRGEASPTALRSDGLGEISIGMRLGDLVGRGLLANPQDGCGTGVNDQFDLTTSGVTGTVQLANSADDPTDLFVDSISIRAGEVDGAGTVGMEVDAFRAAAATRYDWQLDTSHVAELGIWIATLTDRTDRATVEVAVDPTTRQVIEAAAPILPLCG